jgi:hypothetical protein
MHNILIQYTRSTVAKLNKVGITTILQQYCRMSGDFIDASEHEQSHLRFHHPSLTDNHNPSMFREWIRRGVLPVAERIQPEGWLNGH